MIINGNFIHNQIYPLMDGEGTPTSRQYSL